LRVVLAGRDLRGLRLPAGDGVAMERPVRGRLVEPAYELLVPRLGCGRVALVDGLAQPAHQGLRSRPPAQVFLPLPGRLADALLLLLDVRHLVERPARRGRGDGSTRPP